MFCLRIRATFPRNEGSVAGEGRVGKVEAPEGVCSPVVSAEGTEEGEGVAGAVSDALTLLHSVLGSAPTEEARKLPEWVFSGRGIYLYARYNSRLKFHTAWPERRGSLQVLVIGAQFV